MINRLLLVAILGALLWSAVELRRAARIRRREAVSPPASTTIHYYVPDGTGIHLCHGDHAR